MKTYARIIEMSFVALSLFMVSCKRIPLYEPDGNVWLRPNILLAEQGLGKTPENLRVCFYHPDTHALVSEDILPVTGGFINVEPGLYDMIVYTLGNEVTQVEGTGTRSGGYAFTSLMGVQVRISKGDTSTPPENVSVIYEPDHLYAGRMAGLFIPPRSELEDMYVIDCDMPTILDTYTFKLTDVVGIERIKQVDVYITGQARSKYLWDLRFPNRSCAIYFQPELHSDAGEIVSVFNTFGRFPGVDSEVYLNMLVNTGNGRYQWFYDITDQIDNPDNTDHTIVIDDTITIPEGSSGGGLIPVVDAWDENTIYINL